MGKRGPQPGSEAARRVSEAMKGRYGREHFQTIGQAGGRRTAETGGAAHFREAGRKGGQRVLDRYGLEYLHEIASRGGRAPRG